MAALTACFGYFFAWMPPQTAMALKRLLISGWDWEPSVIIGCAVLMVVYLSAARPRLSKEAIYFSVGVLTLFLALVSPLDTLADTYFFSAHMTQHLLLVLVVPPLFVLGLPKTFAEKLLHWPFANKVERLLGRPIIAWPLGIGTFFVWHAPLLYNAALENEGLHIVEHLSMLITSVMFWWPFATPVVERRLSPATTLLYLMPAGVASTLLGILLAYVPTVLYPAYLHPSDPLGILSLIRRGWRFSPKSDQELGGMLMWVPGSFVYIGTILIRFACWFSSPQK
jgi:putative membrane protein